MFAKNVSSLLITYEVGHRFQSCLDHFVAYKTGHHFWFKHFCSKTNTNRNMLKCSNLIDTLYVFNNL